MALLCVGYLAMDCFNADTSDEEIRQDLLAAHYAFQDYAVAHWIDHLKTSSQHAVGPCMTYELVEAINVFFANQWCDSYAPSPRIPKSMKTAFRACEGYDFHDKLLQVYYFREADAPSTAPTAEPLELYATLRRIRRVFEEMVTPLLPPTSAEAQRFREYYGVRWFKCPRLACRRFYDGFASARERDEHEKKHSRSYRCDVPGCFASDVGLASERGLKQHKAQYHSQGEPLFPTFQKRTASKEKADLLFRLAKEGDIDALERHLDGECATVTNPHGDTLLHVAARLRNTQLAHTLLSFPVRAVQLSSPSKDFRSAIVNADNKRHVTPLGSALYGRGACEDMVKLLLGHGAIPRPGEKRKLATMRSLDECLRLLLQNGAHVPSSFPVMDSDVIEFIARRLDMVEFPIKHYAAPLRCSGARA